jgi:hypothetical protein
VSAAEKAFDLAMAALKLGGKAFSWFTKPARAKRPRATDEAKREAERGWAEHARRPPKG